MNDIDEKKILNSINYLSREMFIPIKFREGSHFDIAVSIDCNQTTSQPSLIAYMLEKLKLNSTDKVLEIGTGSGFQTAILAQLVKDVFTIEIHDKLSKKAQVLLNSLIFNNVKYKVGDGKFGWKEFSPYDSIVVSATAKEIPYVLIDQLKIGGRMIIPLENDNCDQNLFLLKKKKDGKFSKEILISVRFVPLI